MNTLHSPDIDSKNSLFFRLSALVAISAFIWAIVFFSHLLVVLDSVCSATIGKPLFHLSSCGFDFVFWPSGFETPKSWVVTGAGILAGILAMIGVFMKNRPEKIASQKTAKSSLGASEKTPATLSHKEYGMLGIFLIIIIFSTLAADRSIASAPEDPTWYAHLRNTTAGILPPFGSWVGIPEKFHGGLFWCGILGLWVSFRTAFTQKTRRTTARIFLITVAITGLYALAQWLRIDPLTWGTRIEITRAFSTFGNPNYYAGFLLPCIALVPWAFSKKTSRVVMIMALIAILFMTKSLYGLALLAMMGIWESRRWIKIHLRWGIIATLILCIGSLGTGFFFAQSYGIVRHAPWQCGDSASTTPQIDPKAHLRFCVFDDWQWDGNAEKWKGFMARFYIWGSVWNSISQNPKTFLIGRGPDSLKFVFERFRRPELLDDYEDSRFVADRAHNWILDLWHSFGLIGVLVLLIPVICIARPLPSPQKTALILWVAYFFFNIPVAVHWVLFAFLLASTPLLSHKKSPTKVEEFSKKSLITKKVLSKKISS